MEIEDVIHMLKTAKQHPVDIELKGTPVIGITWQDVDEDGREGLRFATITEAMVDEIIAALEQRLDQNDMSRAIKFWLNEFETM